MVNRLELRLRNEGYWPIVFSSHGLPQLEAEAVSTMLSLKVAGALAAPLGQKSDPRAFEKLAQNLPIVYFDTYIEGSTPFIGNNNYQSVATIVISLQVRRAARLSRHSARQSQLAGETGKLRRDDGGLGL